MMTYLCTEQWLSQNASLRGCFATLFVRCVLFRIPGFGMGGKNKEVV